MERRGKLSALVPQTSTAFGRDLPAQPDAGMITRKSVDSTLFPLPIGNPLWPAQITLDSQYTCRDVPAPHLQLTFGMAGWVMYSVVRVWLLCPSPAPTWVARGGASSTNEDVPMLPRAQVRTMAMSRRYDSPSRPPCRSPSHMHTSQVAVFEAETSSSCLFLKTWDPDLTPDSRI